MTPDLSYYWEGAREWCEDNKWDEEKKSCTGRLYYFYRTQHLYPFPGFFLIVCAHSSLLAKILTDCLFLVQ